MGGSGSPCVILAGQERDPELSALATVLRRLEVPVQRVKIDWLDGLEASLQPLGVGRLTLAREALSPTVVWTRGLSPRAVPVDADQLDGTFADEIGWPVSSRALAGSTSQIEATFVADSRVAFFRELTAMSAVVMPGAGPNRLQQLADAERLGIRVPETILTTDPDQAPRAWRRVVVKAIDEHCVEYHAGSLSWFWPRIWDRVQRLPWPRTGVPALLQRYIEHTNELRVFYLNGTILAFDVEKRAPSDPWLAPDLVAVTTVAPPRAVSVATAALADAWKLRYGAFDYLVSAGEPVFLEVNVDGGWRWFERRAGSAPVTGTAARTVAELHNHIAHGRRAARRKPVDLVLSLAGVTG